MTEPAPPALPPELDADYRAARAELRRTQESFWRRRRGDVDLQGYARSSLAAALAHVRAQIDTVAHDEVDQEGLRADLDALQHELDTRDPAAGPLLENPAWTRALTRLQREVEQELIARTGAVPGRPALGTLPIGSTNAVTVAVAEHRRAFVVVIDDGVFVLAHLAAKGLARCFPVAADGAGRVGHRMAESDVRGEIARHPGATSGRFTEAMLALTVEGDVHRALPYLAEPGHRGLAEVIRHGIELFTVAHEYGHVLHGHLDPGADGGPEDGLGVSRPWAEELQADRAGLTLAEAVLVAQGRDPDLAAAVAMVGLDVQHAFELTLFVLHRGSVPAALAGLEAWYDRPGATHPPPPVRRVQLREKLVAEGRAGAVRLADTLSATVGVLGVECLAVATRCHAEGVRPAARWAPMLNAARRLG